MNNEQLTINKWETVIGLEVHVELNTKTKMFCSCSADYFGKEPNTHTCPVCLGLPGALPFINQEAIDKCIKIGLALNCSQNPVSYFERKNYFYPDLAKGYQISQLVTPLNINGKIIVKNKDGEDKEIKINRAHQEEDTGKLTHLGRETLIDFNRSGVPLVEIVTEPDFRDTAEIRGYAKQLQQIFRDLGVSNADMEKGDMRLEANISVRPVGQKELPPYRVELKNINSFSFMVAAVEYEIKRQSKALENGEVLHQETRGWDETKKVTYLQRSKEEANDYRYFPEPDLPALKIDPGKVEEIKKGLPKLMTQVVNELAREHKIPLNSAATIVSKDMGNLYTGTVSIAREHGINAGTVANYYINTPSNQIASTPQDNLQKIISGRSNILDDDSEIEKLAREAIDENPNLVEQYKTGKENVINALIGAVMGKCQGRANADKVKSILLQMMK